MAGAGGASSGVEPRGQFSAGAELLSSWRASFGYAASPAGVRSITGVPAAVWVTIMVLMIISAARRNAKGCDPMATVMPVGDRHGTT